MSTTTGYFPPKVEATVVYIEEELKRTGRHFTPIKLQILLYLAQQTALRWTGQALFTDDFEAWPRGPAIARINLALQGYYQGASLRERLALKRELPEHLKRDVDSVLRDYGDWSTDVLERYIQTQPAFIAARHKQANSGSMRISKDALLESYVEYHEANLAPNR